MEFKDLIYKRRSCRHFNNTKVSDEALNNILEAARMSQSARNRQPWYIKVLKDDLKNKVSDILINSGDEALKLNGSFIKDCDTLLLIYTDLENKDNVSDLISLGSMIEHICLSAYDNNLGALWMRYLCRRDQEINELLNINDKFLVSGVLLGGYDGELKVRPRKELEEIILK